MEILILVLLYYFSQNPQFAESVQPLMEKLKDSQHMLDFLNDLSKFTETFSTFKTQKQTDTHHETASKDKKDEKKENPQSPTSGIADAFIEEILNEYLKKQ